MTDEAENASQPNWQGRFFAFFGAQAVSLIGSNIAQFAITWWLARSLESATVLAMATLMVDQRTRDCNGLAVNQS